MPNLYNGYCYPDMQTLTDAFVSAPVYASGAGLGYSTLAAISGDTATFNYMVKSDTTVQAAAVNLGTYSITFPSCASAGYLTNYSGMALVDVIEVSWAVVLCWAAAWLFKNSRRAL